MQPDDRYQHHFHAGNAADVWKHTALVAVLDALAASRTTPLRYAETHAGAGRYHLGPAGEWREGIGRLLEAPHDDAPTEVRRYLELLDARPSKKGVRYLGSPLLVARALGARGALSLYEIDGEAAGHLRAALEKGEAPADVVEGDGVAALASGALEAELVLVDPPWVAKSEWTSVPDAIVSYGRRAPRGTLMLWYPVKSLTRPNAMFERLRAAGVPATVVELSPAPAAVAKNRLVGSGLVLVGAPPAVVERLALVAAWLGPRLATKPGVWSMRALSWAA